MKRKIEWRLPDTGWQAPMRCLAIAEGHAMVRYKGSAVHVIPAATWERYSICGSDGTLIEGEGGADG